VNIRHADLIIAGEKLFGIASAKVAVGAGVVDVEGT
jgi:hypothetical protein